MKKIKINLGSGKDYKKGFINVDISDDYRTDIIADLSKAFPFKDDYADEIYASDILEHFTKEGGIRFLEECYRVLKKGGKITIRTHNIFQIFRQFSNDPEVLIHFLYGDTKNDGIYGAHKFAYTKKSLTNLLSKLGFSVVEIFEETTNWVVVAKKDKKQNSKKLKIAVIQQSPDMGGAEFFMLSLLEKFRSNGHIITIATDRGKFFDALKKNNFSPEIIPHKLDIIGNLKGLVKSLVLLPYMTFFYINLLSRYKRSRVDVILMSGFSEKMLVTALSVFYRIPVVWVEYGPLEAVFRRNFYLPKIIYRLLKEIPKKVIVPTNNTKQNLLNTARLSLSRIDVIPCGVEVDLGEKKTKKKDGEIIIGNVSRLTREKGQQYIIDIIPLVVKKYPKVKFVFVGDGPDREYFIEKARELGVEQSVEFVGFTHNKEEYYQLFNIFIFPSNWKLEGFGLVVAEAMMHKIPVIGNDFGPIKETLSGGAGVLVDVRNEERFSKKILELIQDRKLRNKIGEKGFLKAREEYDIAKVSRAYEEVLEDVVYFGKRHS